MRRCAGCATCTSHAPSAPERPWSSRIGAAASACWISSMLSGRTAKRPSSMSARWATIGPPATISRPLSAARWSRNVRRVVLAGLALGFAACGDASSDVTKAQNPRPAAPRSEPGVVTIAPDSPQLGQIRVAAVDLADVPQEGVVAPARVGIDPNRLSKVLMPVPGRIEEVMARLGDRVEQGQAVVALESPDADAAVGAYRQAEAAERQSEAALAKAEADYQRARDLREHGAVAQKDLL